MHAGHFFLALVSLAAVAAGIAFHPRGRDVWARADTSYTDDDVSIRVIDSMNYVENFDPQRADPHNRIACFGDLPDFHLPNPQGDLRVQVRDLTLTEICAKPAYGGKQYANIGGFCRHPSGQHRLQFVGFDIDRTIQKNGFSQMTRISKTLKNPRLAFYCLNRCFCTYDYGHPAEPRTQPPIRGRFHRPDFTGPSLSFFSDYEINVQTKLDWLPVNGKLSYKERVPVFRIPYATSEREAAEPYLRGHERSVSIPVENRLKCNGPLPEWDLPTPFRKSDFANINLLCAAHLSGGLAGGNVGGICLKVGDNAKVPYFLKEFVPHPSLLNSVNNRALAVRIYCFSACSCDNSESNAEWPAPGGPSTIPWLGGAAYKASHNGEVSFTVGSETVTLVNKNEGAHGPTQGTSSCSMKDAMQNKCTAWPSEVLGPEPKDPFSDFKTTSLPSDKGLKVKAEPSCGTTCKSRSDCPGNAHVDGCICAASARFTPSNGLWKGFFCVVVSSLVKSHRASGALGGRDVGDEGLVCPCNSTYISSGCCGSISGLVWESPNEYLGQVSLESMDLEE